MICEAFFRFVDGSVDVFENRFKIILIEAAPRDKDMEWDRVNDSSKNSNHIPEHPIQNTA